MYRDNKKIEWLLFERNANNTEIVKKCQINRSLIYKLKKNKELIDELADVAAYCLTTYAQELLENKFYENYRWVVADTREIDVYNFRNLIGINQNAKLVSQVVVTPEVKKYEHIKEIHNEVPLFHKNLVDGRELALQSVGF